MILSIVFILAIAVANLLVGQFGAWVIPINTFFLIGLDLMIRDKLHDTWHSYRLLKMSAMVLTAGVVSYVLNPDIAVIAFASTASFMMSMAVDFSIYRALIKESWMTRANGSNIPAALVDSILFPLLAFGMLTPEIIFYQFIGKAGGGALFSIILQDCGKQKITRVSCNDLT